VGANSTSGTAPGAGGDGRASLITGTSVTRAGGGGGGNTNDPTVAAGGAGGGGAGGSTTSVSVAGTANTGGGGGGGGAAGGYAGAAGGSGVVILSVPTSIYSGVTSGSPTITTSGVYTILQFNSSGSYRA
jgi:hypothetical protein